MPSVNIENGKRIEDLLEISTFSASAHFLVSEHNLTRKTSLTSLRAMFNGDTATADLNNLYYSVEKLNELFDNVGNEFNKLTERLDTLNLKIQDIYISLGADLDEFRKKLELLYNDLIQADGDLLDYINQQITIEKNARIEADNDLSERLNLEIQMRTDADTEINNTITELSSTVTNNYTELTDAINNEINNRVYNDNELRESIAKNADNIDGLSIRIRTVDHEVLELTNRVAALESKITISANAPGTSLETGKIWLQYF